jgi:hypothetical protein
LRFCLVFVEKRGGKKLKFRQPFEVLDDTAIFHLRQEGMVQQILTSAVPLTNQSRIGLAQNYKALKPITKKNFNLARWPNLGNVSRV